MSYETNYSANSTNSSFEVIRNSDVDPIKVKSFVKDLLKSRIFLGRYLERRLADQRIGYRDVVLLSPAEVELKRDLLDVQCKLSHACPNVFWIGVTDAVIFGDSSGVCIWTEIDNVPFGPFWFQIKSVRFRQDEVIVLLKCIRQISDSFLELEPILTGSHKSIKIIKAVANNSDIQSDITSFSDSLTEIIKTLKGALSIRNVKEFTTFVFALVIAMFTGSTAFINFLGNFVLALLRELSIFIKNSTPLFLGFLDFLSKIVGGFYILLAMMFKPSTPMPPLNRRSIDYYERNKQRSKNQVYEMNSFD